MEPILTRIICLIALAVGAIALFVTMGRWNAESTSRIRINGKTYQLHRESKLRLWTEALSSRLRGGVPTPPEPFGYKQGWLAVRAEDSSTVAAALPFRLIRRAGWKEGVVAADKPLAGEIFVTPPVNGWVLVVGVWASSWNGQEDEAELERQVAALSVRFGEAQFFGTQRVVEYHQWILAKEGQIQRCFGYVGDKDESICNRGPLTGAEKEFDFAEINKSWFPDEQDVMKVAADWSLDPTQLSANSGPSGMGVLMQGRNPSMELVGRGR
jgi:hypothetical protein